MCSRPFRHACCDPCPDPVPYVCTSTSMKTNTVYVLQTMYANAACKDRQFIVSAATPAEDEFVLVRDQRVRSMVIFTIESGDTVTITPSLAVSIVDATTGRQLKWVRNYDLGIDPPGYYALMWDDGVVSSTYGTTFLLYNIKAGNYETGRQTIENAQSNCINTFIVPYEDGVEPSTTAHLLTIISQQDLLGSSFIPSTALFTTNTIVPAGAIMMATKTEIYNTSHIQPEGAFKIANWYINTVL